MEIATTKGRSRAGLPTFSRSRGEVMREGEGRGFHWLHITDMFAQVGTSCSHPRVCTCGGGSCTPLLFVIHPMQVSSHRHLVLVPEKQGGHTNNGPSPYVSTYFPTSVSHTIRTLFLQLWVCCLEGGSCQPHSSSNPPSTQTSSNSPFVPYITLTFSFLSLSPTSRHR